MKRTLLLSVAVLAFVAAATAQEHRNSRHERKNEASAESATEGVVQSKWDGAHIAFAKTKHDFGEVGRKGGDLTVQFEYVNDGSEPLVITRIATSCTCIRATYSRRPLAVGEHGVVELTYEPHKMEPGTFHKVVQVYSNSADGMRLLTVSGNSVEKQK